MYNGELLVWNGTNYKKVHPSAVLFERGGCTFNTDTNRKIPVRISLPATIFFKNLKIPGGYDISPVADHKRASSGGKNGFKFRFNSLRSLVSQTAALICTETDKRNTFGKGVILFGTVQNDLGVLSDF